MIRVKMPGRYENALRPPVRLPFAAQGHTTKNAEESPALISETERVGCRHSKAATPSRSSFSS